MEIYSLALVRGPVVVVDSLYQERNIIHLEVFSHYLEFAEGKIRPQSFKFPPIGIFELKA